MAPSFLFYRVSFVTVFCDASYCPLTHAYGYAVWVKYGDPPQTLRGSGGGLSVPSSQHAELVALQQAIQFLQSQAVVLRGRIVVLQSDCRGALREVDITPLQQAGARHVKKKHVQGHQGTRCPRSAVNTWCDREAGRVMREYRAKNRASG